MFAAPVFAALDKKTRRRAERVVRRAERRNLAVAVIVDAEMQPDLRHPLGMAHGAGPGADHFRGRTPAALNNLQRVDQFVFPIFAPARLAPGERGQRGDDGPHMVFLHKRIAIGRFDAPDAEHDRALDAEIPFDAGKQRRKFLGLLLAGDDAPVGDPAVEILPELLVEFGLIADRLKPGGVRP